MFYPHVFLVMLIVKWTLLTSGHETFFLLWSWLDVIYTRFNSSFALCVANVDSITVVMVDPSFIGSARDLEISEQCLQRII